MATLKLKIESASQRPLEVKVWGDRVAALDMGDEVAAALSGVLQSRVRLVRLPDSSHRQIDREYAEQGRYVSFADGFPLLLCTEVSLQQFISDLGYQIAMERFRPNIVIDGEEPFQEDHWQRLKVDGISLDLVKPCSRCVIPSIQPETGEKQRAVLDCLRKTRRGNDGKTYFGQNVLHSGPGTLKVGQQVELLS